MQEKILSYCSVEDLKNVSVTSRDFNLLAAPYLFREVSITPTRISKQPPKNFRFAQTVHVQGAAKGTKLTKKYTKMLDSVTDLRTLVLVNIVTDETLEELGRTFPKVNTVFLLTTSMYLSGDSCQFDTYVKYLKGFPEFYVLRCMSKDLTNLGLSHISQLATLRKLDLHQCNHFTDEGISHLVSLKNLNELFIRSCMKVTGWGFSELIVLRRLYKLDVSYSPIDEQGFKTIASYRVLVI